VARSPTAKTDASEDPDRSAVKSLRKAMTVLNVVAGAERPLTIAEVAINAGIARPTAYRFVQTLVAAGYLAQDPVDGRLSVGFAVLPLASSLLDRNRMRIEALPHLHSLARETGERANLGILYRDRVLYIAGVEKPALPTIYSRFGKNAPAHCSARPFSPICRKPMSARYSSASRSSPTRRPRSPAVPPLPRNSPRPARAATPSTAPSMC